MPAYFLVQAGVSAMSDFAGPPGYSGSHDKTIQLVQTGTYEGGATTGEAGIVSRMSVEAGQAQSPVTRSRLEASMSVPRPHRRT